MAGMNCMLMICCSYICIALASSVGYYPSARSSEETSYGDDQSKPGKYKGGRYYYGGKYSGKCGPDGLYYRDEYSFVLCSNAKGYVQPCAPGTRNTGFGDYAPGYYYGYSDFCDINLVDYGYSAPKYGPGYANKPSYGFAAYRHPAQPGYERNSAEDKHPAYGQDTKGYQSEAAYGQSGYSSGHQSSPHSYSDGRNERYEVPQRRASGYQTQTGYTQH